MDQPAHVQDQESFTIEDDEITKADSDSSSNTEVDVAVPNYWQSAIFTKNDQLRFHRVEERSSDYVKLKRCFVNGMRNFDNRIDVIAIHKKNHKWSKMDEARVESFRVFTAAVASKNGGDPNIKYGWYGGSREEISEILCNGFCTFQNTSPSHGHGVYFSPANNPMYSKTRFYEEHSFVRNLRLIAGDNAWRYYNKIISNHFSLLLQTSCECIIRVD